MTSTLDKTIDFRSYLQIPRRRKGILILASVAVMCSALVGLSLIPKQYESSATLMIEEGEPLIRDLDQVLGRTGPAGSFATLDQMRLSQLISRIQSRPFLEQVAGQLKMTSDPAVRAAAEKLRQKNPEISTDDMALRLVVRSLKSRISFRSSGMGTYEIVVADFNPSNAQLLARYVSELFCSYRKKTAMDEFRAARDFAEEQLTLMQEDLRQSEEALEHFKSSRIRNLEDRKVHAGNLDLADFLKRRIEAEGKTAEMRMGPLARAASQAGITVSDATVRNDPETQKLQDQLSGALTRAVDDLLAMAGPEGERSGGTANSWPPQGASFAELRQNLSQHLEKRSRSVYPRAGDEEIRIISGYAFQRMDADAESRAADYLSQQIEAYRTQAQAQPVDELELQRLEDEVTKDRKMLALFDSQKLASDIRQKVEATSLGLKVDILDPANLPLEPSRPDRVKTLVAALLFGPLIGTLFAFLAEMMDSTLRTLHEIQRLAPEPILCTAPLISKLRPRRRGFRRHWVPAAVTGVVALTAVFFIVRVTLLQERVVIGRSIQAVDPGVVDPKDATKP